MPLIRHQMGNDDYECGLLFDVFHVDGRTGFSATVFVANVLLLPTTVEDFLKLPHEHYDTVEDIYLAGWRVD